MKHSLRRIFDTVAFIFIIIIVPLTSYFELAVVFPVIHGHAWSVQYTIAFMIGCFIVFNVKLNLIGMVMTETSVKDEVYIAREKLENKDSWRMCNKCKILCPPRSWHCDICQVCILRRDHHCMYSGKCIGINNYRYFFMFVVYFLFGSFYIVLYNTIYMVFYRANVFLNYKTLIKFCCPIYFFLQNPTLDNAFILIYELSVFGLLQSLILFFYHVRVILKGGVSWEIQKGNNKYDLGWKKNLRTIFGDRMHLMWLSPFIESELPADEIHWD